MNFEQRRAADSRDLAPDPDVSSTSRSTVRSGPRSSAISGSPIPAVVTAAVPRRRPLVTNGFSGSFGIAFLLQVMPASSSASCATLPVTPKGPEIDEHEVVVGAARHDPEAFGPSPLASARAFRTISAAYSPNSGRAAFWNATALAAMTCMSGPPWRPGKTALSIAFAASRHRMRRPGGRGASCGW